MATDGWDGETLQFFPLFFARQLTKVLLIACRPTEAPRRGVSTPRAVSQRGFTLIEIMVVVFILGLLVTLVAPKILGRTDEAKQTKAAADLRAIEQALHLYKLDNGNYPTTDQGLKALVSKPESGLIPARWNPEGYLEKMPVDPWGHPYLYLSNGERYTLKSLGADGEEGGEGKYADLDSHDL
jgi:general secretion pathway protein G